MDNEVKALVGRILENGEKMQASIYTACSDYCMPGPCSCTEDGIEILAQSKRDADLIERLAQSEPAVPVAWMYRGHLRDILEFNQLPEEYRRAYDSETPLYAHPPRTPDVEAVRSAIDSGLRSFCSGEPDFTMSPGMRRIAIEHILAQPGALAAMTGEAGHG